MFKRMLTLVAGAAALAAGLSACGGSGSSNATAAGSSGSAGLPTVTMMVGGIDKQIYLPYQLAQDLGFYKKYGVNVQLSTEQAGGVGAETAMVSGQVDMAGAWYVHTIDFQQKGKNVIDVVNLSGAPGEREMCAKSSGVTSPGNWAGKSVGVTDIGSGTDNLTLYLGSRYHLSSKQFSRVQQWLGGAYPSAGVLAQADWVNSHKATVQKVVDALVATMHWINTHTAADIARIRLQRAHDQGRLHRRAGAGQGPVPTRRDDARERTQHRLGRRQTGRQRNRSGERLEHLHQRVRDCREQARGVHKVVGCVGTGPQ
jgi:NitT/TauT family transport system substrate-binding protein